jgi:signal transduction histidine kinase
MHEDRLNLIGKMASSMAHEIRNPLTSIGGFLKLIRINIQKGNLLKLIDYINIIDSEFDKINMQITGFLSFSKNRAMEEKNIEISTLQIVNATLSLLNPRLINDNIDLKVDEENNNIICIQKIAIQQVISNIVNNAIDALNSVDYHRKIRIYFNQDDQYNYINIVNNGPKIPGRMRDSLFLPFVTDKDDGTGLGLAICKEIMAKNNGEIYFKSNNEQTSFILSFSKLTVMS